MPKFVVTGSITISVSTEVEADNEEHAKELAAERPMQSLCHQCSTGSPREEWVTSGDLDGEPEIDGAEAADA